MARKQPPPGQSDPALEPEAEAGVRPEKLVRRAALALVVVLLVAGYFLRATDPPEASPSGQASASAASVASSAINDTAVLGVAPTPLANQRANPPSPAPSTSALQRVEAQRVTSEPGMEASLDPTPPEPTLPAPSPPLGTPAVELPNAEAAPAPRVASGPVSPCGDLFVRLITHAEDQKFAFASIAKGFSAPAELVHIGDTIGGFRVTGIEWDRVWVQSAGQRCSVGMHLGAREADQAQGLTAEQYARLPWVLPHAIVSGLDKRSEMEFELDEVAIKALYERGSDVFAGLRVKRVELDAQQPQEPAVAGSAVGLQLFDIRIDSFLERLGIESGDVLLAIAQQPVHSVDAVQQALERARDAQQLVAEFRRDGESFHLELRARPNPR